MHDRRISRTLGLALLGLAVAGLVLTTAACSDEDERRAAQPTTPPTTLADDPALPPGMEVVDPVTVKKGGPYRVFKVTYSGAEPPYHGFALMDATPLWWNVYRDKHALGASGRQNVDYTEQTSGGEVRYRTTDEFTVDGTVTSLSDIVGDVTWTMKGKLVNPSADFVNPLDYVASGTLTATIVLGDAGEKATISGTVKGHIHYTFHNADDTPGSMDKDFTWTFTGVEK